MATVYEVVLWDPSGDFPGCKTIAEAVKHLVAGSYVIAVENGVARALNPAEEAEYDRQQQKVFQRSA